MRMMLAIALSALLTGCFPFRYTDRPAVSGHVVSIPDSAPIAAATVRATFHHPGERLESVELATGPDGNFLHPGKSFWGVYFVSQNLGQPGVCKIEVTAEGHETEVREFRWQLTGPSLEQLGPIELRSKAGR